MQSRPTECTFKLITISFISIILLFKTDTRTHFCPLPFTDVYHLQIVNRGGNVEQGANDVDYEIHSKEALILLEGANDAAVEVAQDEKASDEE